MDDTEAARSHHHILSLPELPIDAKHAQRSRRWGSWCISETSWCYDLSVCACVCGARSRLNEPHLCHPPVALGDLCQEHGLPREVDRDQSGESFGVTWGWTNGSLGSATVVQSASSVVTVCALALSAFVILQCSSTHCRSPLLLCDGGNLLRWIHPEMMQMMETGER